MSPRAPVGQLVPHDRAAWRAWLSAHHGTTRGVRLILDKKAAGRQRLTLEDAVEEALCFGWIDSTVRPVDDRTFSVLFTPRRRGSTWSRPNRERVESLVARGLMTDAGRQAVARARADGSWAALDDVDALRVPGDLVRALAAEPEAERRFGTFSASAQKATIWWVTSAKRPETRARRVAEAVRLAALGKAVGQG